MAIQERLRKWFPNFFRWLDRREGYCETACESVCEQSCEDVCETGVCQVTCEGVCESLCEAQCEGICEATCEDQCQINCEAGCELACQSGCEVSCETGCEVTCESSCELSCQTACEASCQVGCEINCEASCELSCQTTCEAGCETSCETACEYQCETSDQWTYQEQELINWYQYGGRYTISDYYTPSGTRYSINLYDYPRVGGFTSYSAAANCLNNTEKLHNTPVETYLARNIFKGMRWVVDPSVSGQWLGDDYYVVEGYPTQHFDTKDEAKTFIEGL